MKNKKNICIFGYLDSEGGQLYNLLHKKDKNKVKFFVCFGKLPKINISLEHKKRPNKTWWLFIYGINRNYNC